MASFAALEAFLRKQTRSFIFYDSFEDLLPGEILVSDIDRNHSVQDFEKVFNVNFAQVVTLDGRSIEREQQRINGRASDDLNTFWTQTLEEEGKYNFSVNIIPHETSAKIEFMIDRSDQEPLYLEQKSKGFRWFSSFNLRLRALGVDDVMIKNLVILIDEPGQGLHERAQKDVKKIIEELGKKGAQIIYSTHYPNLIGTEGDELARLRLVSNSKSVGTKIDTVAQFAARADQGSKDVLSPIITAMGISSVAGFVDEKRKNVVVEGISDHYYLSAFRNLLGKSKDLYFVPACGVSNVPNLVSVLLGWGYDYKGVFDDDASSGRRTYNLLKNKFYERDDKLAHENILKIQNCKGIEDIFSQDDFYKFVLGKEVPTPKPTQKNSELVGGTKELYGRLFLESVASGTVNLDRDTKENVERVFDWLYEKFKLS